MAPATAQKGSSALLSFLKSLTARKRPEPSYPTLPQVDESGRSNVPGVFLAGEAAGTPLIKLGLNQGHEVMDVIATELAGEKRGDDPEQFDVIIVGSGSSGLGAAVHGKDKGLKIVTLEAAAFANTMHTMTKGKLLLAEPEGIPLKSRVWFEECTKEQLLDKWNDLVKTEELDIRCGVKVTNIQGPPGLLTVETNAGPLKARRVLLAIGKAGNPRRLGIPGETEFNSKIAHRLLDPDDFDQKDILVVGAGDVAAEAAIALAKTNKVIMSAIDKEFVYPKKRNIDKLRALEASGDLRIILNSSVKKIGEKDADIVLGDGSTKTVPNDFVFEMIGAELPLPFFKKIGIRLQNAWDWKRWLVLLLCFLFIYSLYSLKSYKTTWVYNSAMGQNMEVFKEAPWPFHHVSLESYAAVQGPLFDWCFKPFAWIFSGKAYSDILADRGFQQGYLYSLLYTIIMIVFGYMALIRWTGIAKNPKYQTWRYISLLSFQVGFFLGVNILGVQALGTKYAWRAWGIYQPFPLFFNTFFWWYPDDSPTVKYFFIGVGLAGTFLFMPFMARYHGKRFCTWICGCGGLAETLGDRWRHLAPKGERSRRWEFQAALVMAASFLVGMIVIGMYNSDGNNNWWKAYSYIVDFWLVAVIPIALYPFFGGKVWCRYWCPLAAFNQLLSKYFGKLKIVSDDKCISCTLCSTYCQVGVDVMAHAKNQLPFDNSNSACIHCGICIDVCPMGVLSFESSDIRSIDLIAQGLPSAFPSSQNKKKNLPMAV
jgi:NosR/NirI family transcriptional regulator, nitrous oxide reductase regulator